MLIKVCGMRDPENIRQVAALDIQLMGFIFYKASKRYTKFVPEKLPSGIKKVGVFVNDNVSAIVSNAKKYGLDFLQLHGNESPDLCKELQGYGLQVIKAFSIESKADLLQTIDYMDCCDYFLFDTKCSGHGGSGKSFDWSVLSSYAGDTPFLLSGGINPDSVEELLLFSHKQWVGIDINSGFETAPAIKDAGKIKNFIEKISILK